NPNLRTVVRIFNPGLGAQISGLLRDCAVLSSSAIAAPAFVEAALQESFEQRVEVGDRVLVLKRAKVDDPDVVMPIASRGEGGVLKLFPEAGDDALCLADTGESTGGAPHRNPLRRPRRRRLPSWLVTSGQLLTTLADVRLRYVLGAVAAIVLVSALVLNLGAHWDLLTAVYFTV